MVRTNHCRSSSANLCMQSASVLRISAITVSILILGTIAGCQTHEQRVAQQADNLAAAGFLVKPANTPDRQDMLKRLPPHKFVQEITGAECANVCGQLLELERVGALGPRLPLGVRRTHGLVSPALAQNERSIGMVRLPSSLSIAPMRVEYSADVQLPR